MFARSALRATARRQLFSSAKPESFSAAAKHIQRAGFKSTPKGEDAEIVQESEVPVVQYSKGERTQEEIHVTQGGSGPVSSPVADVEKTAIPLSSKILPQLTPTLARFTLVGKVAVITG